MNLKMNKNFLFFWTIFFIIFCSEDITDHRQIDGWTKRKWQCRRSDRITACSQALFDRSHHHSYCWDESSTLRGLLEQKSFRQLRKHWVARAAMPGSCDGSEVARTTLTFHPFQLLSGQELPDSIFRPTTEDLMHFCWKSNEMKKVCLKLFIEFDSL